MSPGFFGANINSLSQKPSLCLRLMIILRISIHHNPVRARKTEELKIKYPTGFEYAVHMTKDEIEQHIRLMAMLKMFELGKISPGKAAD